jgi:ABC-type transport system substrate-binding protein
LAENEGFALRSQLTTLGVRLSLVDEPPAQVSQRVAEGEYGMTATTFSWTTPGAAAARYVTGNVMGYADPAVGAMAARAQSTLDLDGRAELLGTLAETVWQAAPVIPLYVMPAVFLTRAGLANYGPNQLGTVQWENVGWTI